jgi:hypothetical protein
MSLGRCIGIGKLVHTANRSHVYESRYCSGLGTGCAAHRVCVRCCCYFAGTKSRGLLSLLVRVGSRSSRGLSKCVALKCLRDFSHSVYCVTIVGS